MTPSTTSASLHSACPCVCVKHSVSSIWQCALSTEMKTSLVSLYSRTRHSRSSLICSECIWRLVQYGQRKDVATVRKDRSVQMLITVMVLNKFPWRQPGHYILCILLWRVVVMEKIHLQTCIMKETTLRQKHFFLPSLSHFLFFS
jgi:hypothetical protein